MQIGCQLDANLMQIGTVGPVVSPVSTTLVDRCGQPGIQMANGNLQVEPLVLLLGHGLLSIAFAPPETQ